MIRVYDIETTGTPEEDHAEIIEFGKVDVDPETLDVSNPSTILGKPHGDIPPETMAVHHITPEDVADAQPSLVAYDLFWQGFDPEGVVAAHNAKFEKHFTPGPFRWICTYKCALVVWPDAPTHSNQGLRYWLEVDRKHADFDKEQANPPHRALPDAYVTAHILVELLKCKSVDELVKITEYPALLKKLNFGKHRGLKYEEAPADYLEWIAYKSDLDEDTKFTAKYWLKKHSEGRG